MSTLKPGLSANAQGIYLKHMRGPFWPVDRRKRDKLRVQKE